MSRLLRMAAITAALAAAAMPARAAEIKMIASNAVKEAYLQLIPAFEKATGHHVAVSWSGTDDAFRRVNGGEATDIVIAPSATIDDLIARGKLAAGSHVDVAKSPIGVAVKAGAKKPDISSGEALKKTLLSANRIVISAGPSGVYLPTAFAKLGIADEIKGKTTRLKSGESPAVAVANGQGDIGFTQVSEIIGVKGADYVGPLSPDVQHVTVFSAGLHRAAAAPDAAKAFLDFVKSPAAVPVLKKTGLDPG